MSRFSQNHEFFGKIVSLTPTMGLTSDQEATIFKLINLVDQNWLNFSLGTLPHVVVSRHPWRSLNRAPELFLAAMNGTLPAVPEGLEMTLGDRLTQALVQAYADETGVGPTIQASWPILQELFQVKMPATRFTNLMTDLKHPTRGMNWEWLNDLEFTRRWLNSAGIEDLTHLDTIRYITQMIDAKNTQDVIEFPFHERTTYLPVLSTIRRVIGFWRDPRVIHEVYELAQSVAAEQIDLDRAVEVTLEIIYSLGREVYQRVQRRLRRHLHHRFGRRSPLIQRHRRPIMYLGSPFGPGDSVMLTTI